MKKSFFCVCVCIHGGVDGTGFDKLQLCPQVQEGIVY